MKARIIATCLLAISFAMAQVDDPPMEIEKTEEAKVRLVLIDAVVVDQAGNTVEGLTAEDFEIVQGGTVVPVDTLDVVCPAGGSQDVRALPSPRDRVPGATRDDPRRLVILLDYLHLDVLRRNLVFDQVKDLVKHGGTEGDEIMIAALTGGVRIEQPFTTDSDEVLASLRRMEHDISLWNGNFAHYTEIGFVDGMTALFDVLGTVPGPKAVVMYSAMEDVPLDLQFAEVATVAAAARCTLYPIDARGLYYQPMLASIAPGGG